MKAIMLAAGLGTRLGALTAEKPKAMVAVADRPMCEWVIGRLKKAGVTQLIVNLHYKGDLIKEFFKKKENFGIEVQFSYEPEILGTGGGLKNVEWFFKDTAAFIVHNCDVYSDIDLNAVVLAHKERNALATLVTRAAEESSYLCFNSKHELVGWENHSKSQSKLVAASEAYSRKVFTGIQVLSPRIFGYMTNYHGAFSIIDTYLEAAAKGERVQEYSSDAHYWIDMGTPEKHRQLGEYLFSQAKN
jgi:NDP-sugar pyrophosphorylase family protein